ncbi:thioredoxin family protein [Hydrogenivirga sp.]
MRGLVLLLLIAFSFGGFFNTEVDYFKDRERERAKEERKLEKKKREEYYEKLWEETRNWFPENVSPIERELYKHPDDPVLQEMYKKYVEERTYRARFIKNILVSHFKTKEQVLEAIKSAGVQFLYFHSPKCPYCKMSEVALKDLSRYARIVTVNVDSSNPQVKEMMSLFMVRATPTLVAMKGAETLDVWIGAFTWDSMEFHEWLSGVVGKATEVVR